MDEQDPLSFAVEDECGRRHMAGKGAAGMDAVRARDLAAQKLVPPCRHTEGFRMPVEDLATWRRKAAGSKPEDETSKAVSLPLPWRRHPCSRDASATAAGRFSTMSSAAQRMRFSSISRVVSLSGHRM